jgi:hypothetical protein
MLSDRIELYLRQAREADERAATAADLAKRTSYVIVATGWREMAQREFTEAGLDPLIEDD